MTVASRMAGRVRDGVEDLRTAGLMVLGSRGGADPAARVDRFYRPQAAVVVDLSAALLDVGRTRLERHGWNSRALGSRRRRRGSRRHGWITRTGWPTWFARDDVFLSADHLPYLRQRFQERFLIEGRTPLPFLPIVRAPSDVFEGRRD